MILSFNNISFKDISDINISTPFPSNRSYNANTYSYGSTNSNTANSSSISSSKTGQFTTDVNLRDAPNTDAYSIGIHFKDAKADILDETSYETEGKIATWYKIRVTEYGCSSDAALGCGKNTPNDADEGWVNARFILVTNGSKPAREESNERLTEAKINTLLNDMDNAMESLDVDRMCSHISANAKITGNEAKFLISREQYCYASKRGIARTTDLVITRKNIEIVIASDGQTAVAISNAIVNETIEGKLSSSELKQVIVLGLENGKPVITSIEMKIQ